MKMYTVSNIAELLQLDVETIRRYIYRNKLKAFKIGQEWRVKEEDLNNFIEKDTNIKEAK